MVRDEKFLLPDKALRIIAAVDIMPITQHLTISGKVQGVFFRESMHTEAERLGVTGWVRNCSDGTVEAVVQGTSQAVTAIIAWAQRGPKLAQVIRVEVTEEAGENYSRFDKLLSG